MDSKLFSQRLPSTSGTQSVYEAIRLHEQHPASAGDDVEDDAHLDEENLETRFQDQDLDALLAEAGESNVDLEGTTNHDGEAQPIEQQQEKQSGQESVLPDWTAETEPQDVRDNEGDNVPASLLMEGRGSESPPATRREAPGRLNIAQKDPYGGKRNAAPQRQDDRPTEDDDVPASLLFGGDEVGSPELMRKLPPRPSETLPAPLPGPSTRRPRVQWNMQQEQSHRSRVGYTPPSNNVLQTSSGPIITDPAERAMWMWANVENLDGFLAEIYTYFRGKGIWSILLSKLYDLLNLAFVIGLGTFLTSCVDYHKVPGSKALPEVIIPRCTAKMSGLSNLLLWILVFSWLYQALQVTFRVRRYWAMHEFFKHLLHITENELQTITWQAVVGRLMNLRDLNARTAQDVNSRNRKYLGEPSKQRMDAHDIANRLMRKDNYLIALFNKDILSLTLPVPFLRNRQLFSYNLQWYINLCVLNYVFNESGQVSQLFLRDSHRGELIEALRRRFQFFGFISIVTAPFIVAYSLWLYFLRYFTEFQKNPSQVGSRSYTPLAEWKFREFNELYNFFERRLNMSRPFAMRYLDQFPKDKVSQTARFVAFVAGSLASVLGLASLLDPDLFLGFEITKERTVLFYLGVFGTVWAVARGMVAEEEDNVFDPEYAIKNVAEFTHYKPGHWDGRLHSEEVRREFSQLYQMRILIFLEEILSMIYTPFILWYSLPDCSARIVDFFREFTVHVDGLGYVCSFALFEFQKEGVGKENLSGSVTPRPGSSAGRRGNERLRNTRAEDPRKDYYATKDNKMLASYYSFIDSYAHNPTGKAFNRAHDKRIFRPPPSFPSVVHENAPGPSARRQPSQLRKTADNATPTRKQRPVRSQHPLDDSALAPSLLLDPQHHPSPENLRRPGEAIKESLAQSRSGARAMSSRRKELMSPPNGPVSLSTAIDEDSNLGDSWKTGKTAQEVQSQYGNRHGNDEGNDDDASDQDQEEQGGNDAGVLGLLYEFQKAQAGGGMGGVKI